MLEIDGIELNMDSNLMERYKDNHVNIAIRHLNLYQHPVIVLRFAEIFTKSVAAVKAR